MKLGFPTAIVPGLSLEEAVSFAAAEGLEVCWSGAGGPSPGPRGS